MGIKSFKYKQVTLLFLCLAAITGTVKAAEISQEFRLKAAFVVNFVRFITWPDKSFSPNGRDLNLCVAGENPFGDALSILEGKKIQNHSLHIVHVDSPKNTPQCHLLFVSKSEEGNLERLHTLVENLPIVTVSDIPGFVSAGGSIEFVTRKDRLSFIINNTSLKYLGIQADASMLDLAAEVQ